MKKVLVVDNYDSFTYNLVHYLEDLNCKVLVKRNDQIKIETCCISALPRTGLKIEEV